MEDTAKELQAIQSELNRVIAGTGPPPSGPAGGRGIVICAGGTRYFTNAWVLMKLLRLHGCTLPVELWALDKSEMDARMRELAESLGARVRFADAAKWRKHPAGGQKQRATRMIAPLSVRGRWQWALKPYALLHTSFDEVLYLDADSFPVRDPADLFECGAYRAEGCLFWP